MNETIKITPEIKENIIGLIKNCLLFEEHVEKETENKTACATDLINLRIIREVRQYFTKLLNLSEDELKKWCKGKHALAGEGYAEEIIGKLNTEVPEELIEKYLALKKVRKTYLE